VQILPLAKPLPRRDGYFRCRDIGSSVNSSSISGVGTVN